MVHKINPIALVAALGFSALSLPATTLRNAARSLPTVCMNYTLGGINEVLIEDASLRVQDVNPSDDQLNIENQSGESLRILVKSNQGTEKVFELGDGQTTTVTVDPTVQWRTVTSEGI